jgi:glycosyltransferase involved in cell wall biosynthesis
MTPELSIVIPVMNEKDNIEPLIRKLKVDLAGIDYEVIFVDDGSTDGTQKEIKRMADDRIILVELRRNYGQSTAMTAGIDHAKGKYIAMLDGDLQNDSSDIPGMKTGMLLPAIARTGKTAHC